VGFCLDNPLSANIERALRFDDVFDPVEHAELVTAVAIDDDAAAWKRQLGGVVGGVRRRGEGEQTAKDEDGRHAIHDNTSQLLQR
jgi:hypothetical protein